MQQWYRKTGEANILRGKNGKLKIDKKKEKAQKPHHSNCSKMKYP